MLYQSGEAISIGDSAVRAHLPGVGGRLTDGVGDARAQRPAPSAEAGGLGGRCSFEIYLNCAPSRLRLRALMPRVPCSRCPASDLLIGSLPLKTEWKMSACSMCSTQYWSEDLNSDSPAFVMSHRQQRRPLGNARSPAFTPPGRLVDGLKCKRASLLVLLNVFCVLINLVKLG
ncbi:unnamed protein product, partial [Iphiclides podalirius]